MLWVLALIVALIILGRLFGAKAVVAGCGVTAVAVVGLVLFGGYSVIRSITGSEQPSPTVAMTITPVDKITPDDVFATKATPRPVATVGSCTNGDVEFQPNGSTKCVRRTADTSDAGPTFADTCVMMVNYGTKQAWCDDEVQDRKDLGVDDAEGHLRARSVICTDSVRGRFIRAIWDERPINTDFADFRAGDFMSVADACFAFLNENGKSAAAWRWRAADGVIASYSAQWNDDAGRTESHQTEWSQANDLLTSSLSHASLLPPSDVTVVRQRLQVVKAQLGR